MDAFNITFIGFGEVASSLSPEMQKMGARVSAYDILMENESGCKVLEKRAGAAGISILPLSRAVAGADFILSTVTTQAAEAAARSCAVHLKTGQIYFDLNATTPSVKHAIARIILPTGAEFVEGAILGAVGVSGAKTRILTGGAIAAQAAETLNRFGLNADAYSNEVGKASTYKMLRSVFSKGMEALLIEFLIAGRRAGIQDDLWQEISELFTQNPFERVAANWIQTHAGAHERRYHEMRQVNGVLQEIGIDPVVSAAVEAFFERSCRLGFQSAFPEKPKSMDAVIAFMEKQLRKTGR
ncbi:MAG: DUF1932 domain-containing protein [Thermodesulfobacteriota bacterium]